MSTPVSRRLFLAAPAAGAFYLATARKAAGFAGKTQEVVLHPEVAVGRIAPELHGHFAEHLGSCTYGGLWVGKDSPIPNVNGYRKQALEWLKELGIPVLRWPGGCFADDYHWRDGIGPVAQRPKRVNIHWGNYTEDNSFGTHEFIGLCREIGAEPYLAGNMGSGTPQELRDWVEYCNYPAGSTLADERKANGSAEPFKVRYWGVGNENWGCGGEMNPEEYAANYRRYAMYIRSFGETRPFLIACGPNGNDLNWSRGFLQGIGRRRLPHGFAMHFYSNGKNTPTTFTVGNMQEQLSSFDRLEKGIVQQRALLDSYDPERRTGLLVDEWGVWDRMIREEEKRLGALWQQNTIRSAVAAAMGLNVFHRQAGNLVMCNIAQIVNVLHSMVLTDGPKALRTPSYWAFMLQKPHRSQTAVRIENSDASPLAVSVSASRNEKELVLTCINPVHDTQVRLECRLAGANAAATGTARILHNSDFNACNTFDAPDRIVPVDHKVAVEPSRIAIELPPMSIVTATVRLA